MTPERQKWWNSLPKEERLVRLAIKKEKQYLSLYKSEAASTVNIWDFIKYQKLLIKAMRKQIAMRPVWEGDDEQDYIHCPTCGSVVACCDYSDYELPKHCEDCGQKLRWKKCVD